MTAHDLTVAHTAHDAAPATARAPLAPKGEGLGVRNPVRLGVIDYLNVAPVYDWLRHPEWRHDGGTDGMHLDDTHAVGAHGMRPLDRIELVAGVPSAMNAALAAGAIDVSNVSSVAFGQHAREWLLLPDLSVAAHGRVASVLLFSRHPEWSALDGGSIAMTSDSATSVALVKLLCERRYGIAPRFVSRPPDLDAMLAEHDAALLIGDIALREGQARRLVGGAVPYVFDLATEWQAWMGLPFVFSVWAARRDRAEPIRDGGALDLLRTSTRWGLAHLDIIAADAARRLDLPIDTCAAYLRLLDYALGERDLLGLRAFLEMAVPGFAWEDVQWL